MSLRNVREGWEAIEKQETELLRKLTVAESLAMFGQLYEAYEGRFQSEEYLAERERGLLAQQKRLMRLAEWLAEHPSESPLRGPVTASEETR